MSVSLFQNRAYRRILLGQAVSQMGTSFSYIAVMAKFYELSGSAEGWAFLAAVKIIPFLLFGMVLGYLSDHLNRKWLLFSSDFCRFALYLGIAFCSDLTLFFVLVFCSSFFEAAYLPTYKSLVTGVLSKKDLLASNAMEETVRTTLAVAGVGISGLLIGTIGVQGCFILDAITYLFSAINIMTIPKLNGFARPADEVNDSQAEPKDFKSQIMRGLMEIKTRHAIRIPVFLWTFILLLIAYEAPLFFPMTVEKGWEGAVAVGYLYAAVSSGSLLTSLYLARRGEMPIRHLLTASLIIVVDSLILGFVALTPDFTWAIIISFFLGITETLFRTYSATEVQTHVPQEAVGRVFSCISTIQEPMKILAMLAAGLSVQQWNAVTGMMAGVWLELTVGLVITGWAFYQAIEFKTLRIQFFRSTNPTMEDSAPSGLIQ